MPSGRRRPGRVELSQEQLAALGLVLLADRGRLSGQAGEAPQEPAVLGVRPAYVPGAPPAVLPEPVEATVVADPVGSVGLDGVATEVAEFRPTGAEGSPPVPLPRRRRGRR